MSDLAGDDDATRIRTRNIQRSRRNRSKHTPGLPISAYPGQLRSSTVSRVMRREPKKKNQKKYDRLETSKAVSPSFLVHQSAAICAKSGNLIKIGMIWSQKCEKCFKDFGIQRMRRCNGSRAALTTLKPKWTPALDGGLLRMPAENGRLHR